MLWPSTRLWKSYHLSSNAPMLLPMHRPAEFGWGRGAVLPCWAAAELDPRKRNYSGRQPARTNTESWVSAATDPQWHKACPWALLWLPGGCVWALPSHPSGPSRVSARAMEPARRAEAGMHEHQNKAASVRFQARALWEYPFNKDFEAFRFLFRLFVFAGSSKKISFVFCWYLIFSRIPTISQEGSLSLPNNNKISVYCSSLLYIFFSSRTSVLCILLHSPLTLFFSAALCFYVSQEGLILYSCVLLARSLTCANY